MKDEKQKIEDTTIEENATEKSKEVLSSQNLIEEISEEIKEENVDAENTLQPLSQEDLQKFNIPKLFKKTYPTEKKFKKKILDKIYLKADLELVKSTFSSEEPFSFVKENIKNKKDANRLISIARQIKKQKNFVKFGPLVLFFTVVLSLFGVVYFWGNSLLSSFIQSSLESVFQAKAEVSGLRIQFPNAIFSIENIAVANKDSPMTNLFEVGKINASFNLLELTRGNVIINDFTVAEVQWGTERKTSGALPQTQETEPLPPNPFIEALLNQMKSNSASTLEKINEQFNPVVRLQNEFNSLESPKIAEELSSESKRLVAKYQEILPNLIPNTEKSINELKSLLDLKPEKIDSLEELKKLAKKTTDAKTTLEKIYSEFDSVVNDFFTEFENASELVKRTTSSLQSDKTKIESLIGTISNFSFDSGKEIVKEVAQTYVAGVLDSYYPLACQVAGFIQDKFTKDESVKEEKKAGIERLEGRTVSFEKNIYPSFLLSNLLLSVGKNPTLSVNDLTEISSEDFYVELHANDITTQPKKWKNPAKYSASVITNGLSFGANVVTDFRENSENPVSVSIFGRGFKIESDSIDTPVIDSIKGSLSGAITVTSANDGAWTASFFGNLEDVSLVPKSFEGNFLSNIIKEVISGIKNIDLKITLLGENLEIKGLTVNSNTDKVIFAEIQRVLRAETGKVKESMKQYATQYFDSVKETYAKELALLESYKAKIYSLSEEYKNYDKKIETLKTSVQNRIEEKAKKAASDVSDKLQDKAKDALKDLLKR